MALDMAQAIGQYGTLGSLANSIPDLKSTLERGAAEEWTPDRFFAEVQQTGWWKQSSDTRRQAAILKSTDPASWQQTLHNTQQKIYNLAQEMGVGMSDADRWALAEHSLLAGSDDQTLRMMIGTRGATGGGSGTEYMGAASGLNQQLRNTLSSQGVPYDDATVRGWVNEILSGRQTLATYEDHALRNAKSRYPNLAEQLDAGMTVRDIASPYMSQMAQTLEIPETDIDLTDSHLQRALTDRDEKGVPRTQPLWAFERQLKDDPRWDKTKNAANQTYDLLARVGADWGFAS